MLANVASILHAGNPSLIERNFLVPDTVTSCATPVENCRIRCGELAFCRFPQYWMLLATNVPFLVTFSGILGIGDPQGPRA
jgi:hypothetical protein